MDKCNELHMYKGRRHWRSVVMTEFNIVSKQQKMSWNIVTDCYKKTEYYGISLSLGAGVDLGN